MNTPPTRSDAEARELLDGELERLAPRREELGEGGSHAVAGWTLQIQFEWEAAVLAWERVAELQPKHVEAVFSAGVCRLELGELDEAIVLLRQALELDDALADDPEAERLEWFDDDPAYKLGTAFHAQGDLAEAIRAYEISAGRNAVGVGALRELARCHLACERPKAALEALDRLERRAVLLSVRAEVQALRGDAEAMLRTC